ncbi:hypothetical protein ACQP2X_00485 [Actinoplanes sp. CA-131856]
MPDQRDDDLVPPMKVMRKRLNGVYRADTGFSGPTRRYVLIVALLVGLASIPTLAAITAGTNEINGDRTDTMDVPVLPPTLPGPVAVSPSASASAGPAPAGQSPAGQSPASKGAEQAADAAKRLGLLLGQAGQRQSLGQAGQGQSSGREPFAALPGMPRVPGLPAVESPDDTAGRSRAGGSSAGRPSAGGAQTGRPSGGQQGPDGEDGPGGSRPETPVRLGVPAVPNLPSVPDDPEEPELEDPPAPHNPPGNDKPSGRDWDEPSDHDGDEPSGDDSDEPSGRDWDEPSDRDRGEPSGGSDGGGRSDDSGDSEKPHVPGLPEVPAERPACHERGRCGDAPSHHRRPDRRCERGEKTPEKKVNRHRRSAVTERPHNIRATRILERSYANTGGYHGRIPEARTEENQIANRSYRGAHRAGSLHHADDQTPEQRRSSRVGRHHAEEHTSNW